MYYLYVDGKLCATFTDLFDAVRMAKLKTRKPYRLIVGYKPDGNLFYWVDLS